MQAVKTKSMTTIEYNFLQVYHTKFFTIACRKNFTKHTML